jgi:hypothetical protein
MAAAASSLSPTSTSTPAPAPEPEHAVEYASIRRRYTDLVKGPNAEMDQIFSAHSDLFHQTFEVEWVEDSPGFRHKLSAIDENVEGLRRHMLRLVAICRKYCAAGQEFNEIGRVFAAEMMHLQGESWFTRLGDLAPALIRFGETLDEIQNYREALLISLETTFSQPMEAFVKREVKEVNRKRADLQSTTAEYELSLSRLLSLKISDRKEVVESAEANVAVCKHRFELVRFDLVNLLNQLEIKKKFQLVERICSGLYANLGFFHQCHTLVANREPAMRQLQEQLQNARRDFAKVSVLRAPNQRKPSKRGRMGGKSGRARQRAAGRSGRARQEPTPTGDANERPEGALASLASIARLRQQPSSLARQQAPPLALASLACLLLQGRR